MPFIVSSASLAEEFLLPPCTLHRGLFSGKNKLLLHKEEAQHILARDKVARGVDLVKDAKGTMRILALALALNNAKTVPEEEFDRMRTKHVDLEAKYDKLEVDFETYKFKHEIQVGVVKDFNKEQELEDMTREHDRLDELVKKLESAACPDDGKSEEEKIFSTRAHLIAKVMGLEQDCMNTMEVGFKAVVEKLQVVNPKVNYVTKGIAPYYKVVGKEIVVPEGFNEEDEQEGDDV